MPTLPNPPALDADFLATCDKLVDVQADANSAGAATGAHGGEERDWDSLAPVYQGLPCRIVSDGVDEMVLGPFTVPVHRWRVLFAGAVPVDRDNRLVWRDPDRGGKPRYLYVTADSTGQTLYWKSLCYELVSPTSPVSP